MNDMTLWSDTSEFFSAGEIADIVKKRGIPGFPTTERGVRATAEDRGWNALPEHLTRWRRSAAGGRPSREYHLTLLPQAVRDALAGSAAQSALVRRNETDQLADSRKLEALRMHALPQKAHEATQARAEVLRAIEGYAFSRQIARAPAIVTFLEAQEEYHRRRDIERRRDEGRDLTEREVISLGRALVLTAPDGFGLDPGKLVTALAAKKKGADLAISDRRVSLRIGRSSLYDWFKARDERGVLALAPMPTKREEPIPDAFHDFMRFYAKPGKPTIADAHRQYLEAAAKRDGVQPMTLTLDQVRRILRVRLNDIEKHVGREGILTLRSRMSYITRTTEDMWPTTIYTADGKTFDAEVADPVSGKPMRPEITSVLDVATRKCVGYAVSRKENVIAVTEALRRSCSAEGICAIFYTDRGAGYKNKVFDSDWGGLMARLGITKMHALPYNSQAKGIIERFNHVWNDLARRMPTYMGRDMDKEAKQAIHKETRREIREIGFARRLPTWETFISEVEATIAAYNDRPHDSLPEFEDPETGKRRHMTPNEAWAAHVSAGFEPVRIDPEDEDDLFRPYETRMARRSLVEWNTNKYFHPALEAWHGRDVAVGYDLHQADKVWVREVDVTTGQPGRLICVARFGGNSQRYIPLTAEQAAVEKRSREALKRLDRKRRDKLAELDAPYLIDATPIEPAPFLDAASSREPVQAAPIVLVVDNPAAPRRRVFATDEDLAVWALDHPDELSPNQIRVLRSCVNSPAHCDLFRLSGIDVEALRTLLRAVA